MTKLLEGKKILVLGVADEHSLAWGATLGLHKNGAKIGLNYVPAMEKRVRPLAEEINADFVLPLNDVKDDKSMDEFFAEVEKKWGTIDGVVHSIAHSMKEELKGGYTNVSRENFVHTMQVSCFSFTDVCKRCAKLMPNGGSMLTFTYYGGEKMILNYNVMGVAKAALDCSVKYLASDLGPKNIRVNAVSFGPARTLSAMGISEFRWMLKWNARNAPLQRNITLEDAGNAATYMMSDFSSAVSGEIHHVDCGYNSIGMISSSMAERLKDVKLDDEE